MHMLVKVKTYIGVEAMRDVDEDTNNADYNIAIGSTVLKGGTLGGNFIGNMFIGYRSLDATDQMLIQQ